MHNHNGKHNRWMMWAMMICCAVPLLVIVMFGFGGSAFGTPALAAIGGIAIMVAAHFFLMGVSHTHSGKTQATTDEKENTQGKKDDKNHSDDACCH